MGCRIDAALCGLTRNVCFVRFPCCLVVKGIGTVGSYCGVGTVMSLLYVCLIGSCGLCVRGGAGLLGYGEPAIAALARSEWPLA